MFGARLRGRRGPAVLHRRAAPPGPRRSSPRFAGGAPANRAFDHDAVAGRALHRGRPPAPDRPARRPLRRRRRQAPAGRSPTTSPASTSTSPRRKLDPTKMPGEYAAIGQPQGPDPWKGTDVVATASLVGGDLRQGRRRRARRRRRCSQACRSSASARKQGTRLWHDFRSADDPEAPTTVHGQALPLRADAQAARQGQRRAARPRARVRRRARGRLRRLAEPAARRLGAGCPASAILGLPQRPEARQSNALAGLGARVGVGPPARGVRPAGRLLRAADPHGAGRPRARASTPAAPPSRASTSTCSSAAGATTPGARPRPARTSSTPSPCDLCDPDGATPTLDSTDYVFRGPVPADGDARAHELLDAEPRRPTPAGTRDAARLAHQARASSSRRGDDQRQAGRLHAAARRPTATRSTRRSASRTSTTRTRCTTPHGLPARRVARSATRSTGSTSTTSTSPTSTRATTRCAPKGVDPTLPIRARQRSSGSGFNPDNADSAAYTPRRAAPAGRRPAAT